MTTKRNKGVASLDLVLPVAPHYRTDPQVLRDIEIMRTNAASRWMKDDYSHTQSGSHNTNDNSSKMSTLSRPKVEILRAKSPTLKRLLAVRVKLEKYANSTSRAISASRQSIRSTPYPTVHEKQSSIVQQPAHAPPAPPSKQIISQSSLDNGPLDKITYERTWTRTGNVKQKCSLEIWLPKAGLDDDDDGDTSRTVTPEMNKTEKKSPSILTAKSRRSSTVKVTTITDMETKSLDDVSSKKSEPTVIPRVYHYGDYIMDIPEERPRSSKSVTTVKSDGTGSIKSIRRQSTRPHTRRQSASTHHSEEILRFETIEVPASANDLAINTKSTNSNRELNAIAKPSNPSMISELMQRYTLMKKNHQELTQAKLQLEKPNSDSITKSHSPRPRPPPVPESTLLISSDHPSVSVKKLLIETSPTRLSNEHNNTNTKLLERRSTPHKPSHLDIHSQLRIFSLANQRQHRKSIGSVTSTALLPTVAGKKTDDICRTLQRGKTLDVVLDISSPLTGISRVPVQADNATQRTANGTAEQISSRIMRQPTFTLRSEHQQQNGASVGQRFHRSSTTTSVSTNKTLIQFSHSNNGNTDRNHLVPK